MNVSTAPPLNICSPSLRDTIISNTSPLVINYRLYVFPIIFTVGVVGNVLNLFVLNSRGMRGKPTNRLLCAMAIADLCFLLLRVPSMLVTLEWFRSCNRCFDGFLIMNPTIIALSNWFSGASIWVTVGVTTERLIAVKYPLHAKVYLKTSRIAFGIIVVYVTMLLIQLYHFAWHIPYQRLNNCENVYQWKYRTSKSIFIGIFHILAMVTMVIIPTIIITVFNCLLIYLLHQNRKNASKNENATEHEKRSQLIERKITFMVIVILIVFIILNCPSAYVVIVAVLENLLHTRLSQGHKSLLVTSNIMVELNKALNFIIYCLASEHFRGSLFRLFCSRITVKNLIPEFSSLANSRRSSKIRKNENISSPKTVNRMRSRSSLGSIPSRYSAIPLEQAKFLQLPGDRLHASFEFDASVYDSKTSLRSINRSLVVEMYSRNGSIDSRARSEV